MDSKDIKKEEKEKEEKDFTKHPPRDKMIDPARRREPEVIRK